MKASIGLATQAASLTVGDGGPRDRLERPVGAVLVGDLVLALAGRRPAPSRRRSPGQGAPILTHCVRSAICAASSFFDGGILRTVVGVADRRDEQALLGLARHDRRPRVAAGEHRGPRVEPEARLLLVRPVALDAVVGQDRPDLRLEEPDLLRRRLRPVGEGRGGDERQASRIDVRRRCGMGHRGRGRVRRAAGSCGGRGRRSGPGTRRPANSAILPRCTPAVPGEKRPLAVAPAADTMSGPHPSVWPTDPEEPSP